MSVSVIYMCVCARAFDTRSIFKQFKAFQFSFPSLRLVALPRLKNQYCPLFTHNWKENMWIRIFFEGISNM